MLLSLPILVVFTVLLASADMIFAELLGQVLAPEFVEVFLRWMRRGILIVTVGFLALGGLVYTIWPERKEGESEPARFALPKLKRLLGFTEAAVMINAVNLLFFLFVLIQLPYLFGGRLNIASEKFTYAEYARRDFGELVVVAILTLGLILALSAFTRRAIERQQLAFNVSGTILVALTIVMLISAIKRLLLYEYAYGFTQMRVYPHVFMVWLGLLLIWFLVTLWWRSDRFGIGVLVAVLGFIITLDLINPDAFIVRQNYTRFQQQGAAVFHDHDVRISEESAQIDVYYLTGLSDDAVPALTEIVEQLSQPERQIVDERLMALGRQRYRDRTWQRWQSFHLSRRAAYRALLAHYGEQTLATGEES